MNKLDLHGIRHRDVYHTVDKFINDIILEDKPERKFEIVTGYSDRMKELVCEVLDEYKLEVLERYSPNEGVLRIKL